MMLRTIGCCAALILALLVCLDLPAADACDSATCRKAASAKPLDLKKFMQQQAASTRAYARRTQARRSHAQHIRTRAAMRHERHTVAAHQRPAALPDGAAAAFAAEPASPVRTVADGDLGATAVLAIAPAETVGAAPAADPSVQLVAAEEFNEIDRKADDVAMRTSDTPAQASRAGTSWMQWIWSALGGALDALTTALRQLIG